MSSSKSDKSSISADIFRHLRRDQKMRERWAASNFDARLYDKAVDEQNQLFIRGIVSVLGGWPTISDFGIEVTDAIWVLAQHAPDWELKKAILRAMQELPSNEVNQKNIAKTVDRIRTREGKGQLYGTSFTVDLESGTLHVDPIEDEEHIDERRRSLGLDSFAALKHRACASYEAHKARGGRRVEGV